MPVHFQSAGQSASAAQMVAFGWQDPGNEVVVVHVGGAPASTGGSVGACAPESGRSAGPELIEPPLALTVPPLPSALPAEHSPTTLGWQVKPSPQSAAVLHGSSHLKTHCLVVVVAQVVGSLVVGVPASQGVLGEQDTRATPPEQPPEVCSWQIIPAPQSESTEQGFGSQIMIVLVEALPSSPSRASLAQSALGGQAGAGSLVTPSDTQV